METENRLATAGLNQQLRSVRSFSFFQLSSLVRRFATLHNAVEDVPIHVRYRAMPSLAFPPADVDHCELHAVGFQQFLDVTVTFMGLFGPASPLPAFYTERIIQSTDQPNPSRDLMDMFNHRCISLLQLCWEKYRHYTHYQADGSDLYTRWLLSLLGVDAASLKHTTRLRWHKLLPFVGVLTNNVCSIDLLTKIVATYFGFVSVSVTPWIAREIMIPDDQKNRIGMMNSSLGDDLVLGDFVTDYSGKFALRIVDLAPDQFYRLLPDGDDFFELVQLVDFILKDPLDFDVQLACSPRKPARAGMVTDADTLGRMGWNCRLGDTTSTDEPLETVICVADFRNF